VTRLSIALPAALTAALIACAGAPRTPSLGGGDPSIGVSDSLVNALLSKHDVPGATLAVVEDGEVVLARGYGRASVETDQPLDARTPINVASLSKPVSAWGVLHLATTGTIDLDDPVGRHLPSWSPPPGPHDPRGITVRRLLSHTAGLGMPAVPWFPADEPAPDPLDVLLGRTEDGEPVRLERAPGSGWSYSGGGFTVLQVLVEAVTGRSFDRFMRREVFEPLGMDATGYGPREDEAAGYDEEGGAIPGRRYVGTAAAGLRTTADDVARLLVAYHRAWTGRSAAVLAPRALREVAETVGAVELEGVERAFYGLGHGGHRRRDGTLVLYHSGGHPGVRAYVLIAPDEGDGLFVAVNSDRGVPVVAAVREAWGAAHGGDLPPLF